MKPSVTSHIVILFFLIGFACELAAQDCQRGYVASFQNTGKCEACPFNFTCNGKDRYPKPCPPNSMSVLGSTSCCPMHIVNNYDCPDGFAMNAIDCKCTRISCDFDINAVSNARDQKTLQKDNENGFQTLKCMLSPLRYDPITRVSKKCESCSRDDMVQDVNTCICTRVTRCENSLRKMWKIESRLEYICV